MWFSFDDPLDRLGGLEYKLVPRQSGGPLATGSSKRPPGSRDDYLFASTEQGHAFIGTQASTEEVPLADNVSAGRDLGEFDRVNRMIGGNPFYVGMIGGNPFYVGILP